MKRISLLILFFAFLCFLLSSTLLSCHILIAVSFFLLAEGLEPEEDEGPIVNIDVTGTSIRTTVQSMLIVVRCLYGCLLLFLYADDNENGHNEGKEEESDGEHAVNEDLFVDDADIPEDDE